MYQPYIEMSREVARPTWRRSLPWQKQCGLMNRKIKSGLQLFVGAANYLAIVVI